MHILRTIRVRTQHGFAGDMSVNQLQTDSRRVQVGDMFFAIRGTTADGHAYISKAIAKGATAIVCEILPAEIASSIAYVQVANTAEALALAACQYYNHPSSQLKLVGITGTNGKTTTATLLFNLFRQLGYNAGLISTIRYCINNDSTDASHTTPDALTLNKLLADMVAKGCDYCFMEVSSHALVQNRVTGLQFTGGIFSNITHDHLDYHGTFDNYIRAKKAFFDQLPASAFALVNIDDKRGKIMVQNTKARVVTYALKNFADIKGRILENNIDGLVMQIDDTEVHARLIGEFNAYNLLAIYGAATLLYPHRKEVLEVLSNLTSAEGRFDYVRLAGVPLVGIVDYAHTPDALQNVLDTINNTKQSHQHLITLVGCGGDRDRAKRPIMAKTAADLSDKVILTSDNPRTEDPDAILADMQTGIVAEQRYKVLTIANRREAIKTATMLAQPGDIILLAGKGHEKYQEIMGVKHHFDDKEELLLAFEQLKGQAAPKNKLQK